MRIRRPALALCSVATLLFGACAHDPPVIECGLHPNAVEQCGDELARGNLDKAEVHCDLGLEFSPQNPELHANKGLIALLRHDTAMAKRHLLLAIKFNPDHPLQALAKASQLAPEDPFVWQFLGSVLMEQRRFDEAEEAFRHCAGLREAPAECQDSMERARRATKP
ncbi:hypothetical protein ACN469_29210 [Corallococcus terminator]